MHKPYLIPVMIDFDVPFNGKKISIYWYKCLADVDAVDGHFIMLFNPRTKKPMRRLYNAIAKANLLEYVEPVN